MSDSTAKMHQIRLRRGFRGDFRPDPAGGGGAGVPPPKKNPSSMVGRALAVPPKNATPFSALRVSIYSALRAYTSFPRPG